MRKLAGHLLKKYQHRRFHSGHNTTAFTILKGIEAVKGRKLIKQADAYAEATFG